MQISAVCPRCESKYQLDSSLLGKKFRCTNPICRAVIEVRDEQAAPVPEVQVAPTPVEPPAPVQSPPKAESPRVVEPTKRPEPSMAVEPVARPAPPKTPEPPKANWADAPPPVRGGSATAIVVQSTSVAAIDFPADFPSDNDVAEPTSAATASPETPAPIVFAPPPRRRLRPLIIVATLLFVLAAGVGYGIWRVQGRLVQAEDERFQQAEKFYGQHEFGEAVTLLQGLYRDFPKGSNAAKYRFLAELSDVRRPVYERNEQSDEIAQNLERVLQFAAVYRNDPLLKDRNGDLWQTLHQLSKHLTKLAEEKHAPQYLEQAKRSWAEARKFQPPVGTAVADAQTKLTAEFARVEQVVTAHLARQALLDGIRQNLEQTTGDRVLEARTLARNAGLAEDAEVASLLQALTKSHRANVRFVPAISQETRPALVDDTWTSLAVTPSIVDAKASPGTGVVLSLARGVLFALDTSTGDLRWARRVGVDTQVPPLRVPADPITPELVLAVSSDQRSVSALVAETGAVLWQQPLSGACVGTPVLVGRRLLVPTLTGSVEEIDISQGRLIGAYQLGQPLPLGGVAQPGSPLVYFPADQFCVYILDTSNRTCAGIWYTEHAAGAMRHLPIILNEEKAASTASWLLLPEAKRSSGLELTPYLLPIQADSLKPSKSIVTIPGPVSHAPWVDREKLIQISENGLLTLWGMRRKGEREPLFTHLGNNEQVVELGAAGSRSLAVHADVDNLWVLAKGKLQRLQKILNPRKGVELVPRWSLSLGSPLHAAQVVIDDLGQATVFVTTQSLDGSACLCTAVNAEQGTVVWQRQLGVLPQQPLVVAGSRFFAQDDERLFRFDSAETPSDARWRKAGITVATGKPGLQHRLFVRDDKVWQLSWSGNKAGECKLSIQQFGDEKSRSSVHTLPAAPLGTLALSGNGELRLPLANGVLAVLSGDVQANGPDWRAAGADEENEGHVVALGEGDYIVTDGGRTVTRYRWSDLKTWEKRGSHAFAHRVVAAPVVLPGDAARLVVVDASDTVSLLDANTLKPQRTWKLPGKLTLGPALLGARIVCIVDQKRLLCLDADKAVPLWEYSFVADLIGPPIAIGAEWLLSDVSGQFTRLDPATGRTLGEPQRLRANAAASTSPVVFQGQIYVPLTDGTMVILPESAPVSKAPKQP